MDSGEKRRMTYPLRLAISLKDMASHLAHEDGVSLNHFINLAVAERISRLEAEFLHDKKAILREQKLAVASRVISNSFYGL